MDSLRPEERPLYERWLDGLAEGDPRLRELLALSFGRIAAANLRAILKRRGRNVRIKMGDLPGSKPLPALADLLVLWLRRAIDDDADWLRDVDARGEPRRLASCSSFEELFEQAEIDYRIRPWALPGL